jgi:hypothetical protein
VGEKLHEVIDRAQQAQAPAVRVDWARGQYRKIYREKAKKYRANGIQFPFPAAISYDTTIQFDVPFQSPLGDPPFTVPSFTHELEAPLASTMVLAASTSAGTPYAAPAPDPLSIQVGPQGKLQAGKAGANPGGAAGGASLYLRCAHCGFDNTEDQEFCGECGMLLRGTATQVAPDATTGASGQPDATPLAPGTLLKNRRYRVLGQVGKGGFGAVYKAADTELGDRLVAIKEMINQSDMQEAAGAFKREALMLASLQHPALPRIYEHFPEGGRWYLVMDFIEGQTLEEYQAGRILPLEEVLGYGIQLCAVLHHLHNHRPPIIFRDLKPSNIMRREQDGQLVLIDFGIARHFKPGQQKDTSPLGSKGYAAPEQYGKTQTKPQADIYALGATLHCLLSAHDPSETPFFFAPLRAVNPSPAFPEDLEKLVAQMVNMDVGKRPKTAELVRQELERMARAHLAAA